MDKVEEWWLWVREIGLRNNSVCFIIHIEKHMDEYKLIDSAEQMEDWIDSMINLVCLYRKSDDPTKPLLNFDNMVKRFERYEGKKARLKNI